jgi:hypothetical protein
MNQNAIDITKKFIPREKQLEGNLVSVVPFTARKGLNLQLRLVKVIGPAIKEVITPDVVAKMKSGDKDFSVSFDKIVSAFQSVLSGPDSADLFNLIVELMANVTLNGQQMTENNFDIMFVDEYALMYQIVYFVLEVNFASLLKMGSIGNPANQ